MEGNLPYSAFQGLRRQFDSLAKAGYFTVVSKQLSPKNLFLHNLYRVVVTIFVIIYNLQHIIRVIQVRHSTDLMVDTLFILLTIFNTLGKQAAFNLRSLRIHQLIAVTNGPYFAPKNDYHVEILKENESAMAQLLRVYQGVVLSCACMWAIFPIVNKAIGVDVEFTGYYPFDTSTSPGFQLALTYMFVVLTYQAFAQVTLDCTVVALYAQARAQIRMLRYDLEQLVSCSDADASWKSIAKDNVHTYKDSVTVDVQKRFTKCVKGYEHIVRFIREVQSIFAESMAVQFFLTAWIICLTVYKIVGLSILSAEFMSIAMYLACMLGQLYIYCYYGTQLQVESECISQSVYFCDWLSLSPRFRRQLCVMMECCSRPIALTAAYVVPMSLETYISVVRLSYTLFTVLDRK